MLLASAAKSLRLSLAVGAAVLAGATATSQSLLTLANQRLGIGVERASGAVAQLQDLRTGENFARPGTGLWELQLRTGGELRTLKPSQAGSSEDEPLPDHHSGRRLIWRGFPAPCPSNLAVEVVIVLDRRDGISRWRIAVQGLERQELTQVRFPVIHGVPPQSHEQLAVPVWMGQLTSEPRRLLRGNDGKGRRLEWHYPGELSMQCLAFWGDRAGLYVACNDTAAFRKVLAMRGDGAGGIGCELLHWPELGEPAERQWTLPYDVVIGTFQGDWFTAAERYRSWATNQAWAADSRLSRGVAPQWISDTALWVWNRGRSEGVLPPAMELQRQLGLPVSVFWHWWHGCAYDTGFPEYLPPREGAEKFRSALARSHRQGVNALVYMNQRLWGMTTESWNREGAARWAVKSPDGQIHPEIYNTFTRAPCASMCLGTAFWRNTYASLAEQAVSGLGVNGIYMDQACLSLSCYDATHGHPVGGGTYWVNGFRLLASDIRARCAGTAGKRPATPPPVPARGGEALLTSSSTIRRGSVPALAGEGCGEPWLPYLDLMLSLQVSKERYAAPDGWETIPFFHAVYHPYAVLFGNYSSLTMPPYDELWPKEFAPAERLKLLDRQFVSQFCLEQARAFVWGQQPTLANFTLSQLNSRAAEIDYVLRLAKLRNHASKYLLRGTLLRPPRIEVAEAIIPSSRLSIYAGQQGGLKVFDKKVSLAIGAA
ncbi:MAG TPA: DUF6259 domain-containing protein, partial [Verrucomicrobiae bacterium]